MQHQKTIMS